MAGMSCGPLVLFLVLAWKIRHSEKRPDFFTFHCKVMTCQIQFCLFVCVYVSKQNERESASVPLSSVALREAFTYCTFTLRGYAISMQQTIQQILKILYKTSYRKNIQKIAKSPKEDSESFEGPV